AGGPASAATADQRGDRAAQGLFAGLGDGHDGADAARAGAVEQLRRADDDLAGGGPVLSAHDAAADPAGAVPGGAMAAREPVIEARELRKSFGKLEVLRGISLAVAPSEVVALIGPSGCGKSTLLRCLNRLEEPTGGTVYFRGTPVAGVGADLNSLRRQIGMVFQRFNLFPHLTALENVALAPRR